MGSWVLLLRGVGGPTQVPFQLFRVALKAEGFDQVKVYGHTGNAVFESPLPPEEVSARAAAACRRELGFTKDIHVVSGTRWAARVAGNPFPEAADRPSTLHLGILGAEPDPARVEALRRLGDGGDELVVVDGAAYLYLPRGVAASRLGPRFDRGIGVPNTVRNWNTTLRLHALAQAVEAA